MGVNNNKILFNSIDWVTIVLTVYNFEYVLYLSNGIGNCSRYIYIYPRAYLCITLLITLVDFFEIFVCHWHPDQHDSNLHPASQGASLLMRLRKFAGQWVNYERKRIGNIRARLSKVRSHWKCQNIHDPDDINAAAS